MNKMLAIGALVAACATGAHAQSYLQGNLGVSRIKADCTGLTACDKSSTGGKIVGGYGLGKGLSVELTYANFGKFKASGLVAATPVGLNIKGDSLGIGGAYTAALGNSDFVGSARLGVSSNRARVTGSALGVTVSDKFSKTKPYYGFGLGYKLSPAVTLGVDYDNTRFEVDGDKATVSMFSIFARFEF